MRLEDFDYPLDESLIAQHPIEPRDQARLLVVERSTGSLGHHRFDELPALLRPHDLLVVNNTRVIPARLHGRKRPSGGKIELLLIRPVAGAQKNLWQTLIKGTVRVGQQLELPDAVIATVERADENGALVLFPPGLEVPAYAEKAGVIPLPPYIRRAPNDADRHRYQTVFASRPGAVAAPTAGLHFTEPLLRALQEKNIRTASVTLHVGPGTFKPVACDDIRRHEMDPEWFELPADTARLVRETRTAGGRIIAVGSTSVRVLETAAQKGLPLQAGSGETALFIYPGYRFAVVDTMLTNFHLPKSTLFMLVCALAGREYMLEAYRVGAAEKYRFYSYGDAMLIL
ncbi:MAG TPA: tRNA preQ1(34) S-adenosylmethionine ribosyltransferase-isomerase QueA [Nitrospirales bacterium]|nr:tRNA preQ1(34) S-adenosylmethionine ribosyltransferase-isomerase QueA [Nitrospirales bacterium]